MNEVEAEQAGDTIGYCYEQSTTAEHSEHNSITGEVHYFPLSHTTTLMIRIVSRSPHLKYFAGQKVAIRSLEE